MSKRGRKPSSGKGVPTKISNEALATLRKLAGMMQRPMSDVVSELVMVHGRTVLLDLMKKEIEAIKK